MVAGGIFGLWLAAVLQVGLAPSLTIGLGAPDFLLAFVAAYGIYLDRRGVILLSFGAGILAGALAGVNLTIYVFSRAISGYLGGSVVGLGMQRNTLVAAALGLGLTAVAQLILLFLGAHHGAILPYLAGTLVQSMYDGVIAAILFLLIDKLAGPRRQDRY
jgi:cell shape-determining protein MreD